MFDLGGGELLLILVAVLVLFGPKKLPELAQGLGKGLRQFRQAQQEFTEQINSAFTEEQRKESAKKAQPGATNTISRPITPVRPFPVNDAQPDSQPKPDTASASDTNPAATPPSASTDEEPKDQDKAQQ